jgi:tripartite-type tricarboxylate transporter receptor subunit TctC
MKSLLLSLLLFFSFVAPGSAASWPSKSIRVLVGFSPGGTTDLSARVTSAVVSNEFGQSIIIENRPGASGSIAIESLLRGPADGYTIVVGSDSSFYQPLVKPGLSYRTERDLRPITILVSQPIIIAVHPAPGWRSIKDLINAARSRPKEIVYAISSPTGTQALAGRVFFHMAKVKLTAVPYKGGGQAVVDLMSGQVPIAVLGAAPLVPQAKAGRIKLLAVTSGKRAKALPNVPTLAEMGYPGMNISQWFGAMAPAKTPTEIVNRLSLAYNKALADPKVAKRLFNAGLEIEGGTPEEMAKRMEVEAAIWTKAAKEVGLGKN